jgi:glycosyltransferase involved in cell wall biosynthesis
VVQLFNANRQPAGNDPYPRRAENILNALGFVPVTRSLSEFPWNLGRRWHNAYRGLDPIRALKLLLFDRDADLICAHMESAAIPLLLRRWCGFRPKIIIWELLWSPGWRYRDILSRLLVPRADATVVFGSSQVALAKTLYGPDCKVVFVPFCIDTEYYRPAPAPPDDGIGIFSCGADEGRDFPLLIEACNGLDIPVLLKTAQKLAFQTERHPRITQRQDRLAYADFRALYEQARLVVVTTKDTPNASGVTSLMEAMAMGRPTIVTDNPALRDYFAPADALCVVPLNDPAALRAAILDLWQNREKAEAMGRAARLFAEAHFSPERHFTAMAAMFQAVLAD